ERRGEPLGGQLGGEGQRELGVPRIARGFAPDLQGERSLLRAKRNRDERWLAGARRLERRREPRELGSLPHAGTFDAHARARDTREDAPRHGQRRREKVRGPVRVARGWRGF